MEYLLTLAYFSGFLLLIRHLGFFKQIPGLPYPLLVLFFSLKCLAGMVLIYIYQNYYPLDTADFHKYFKDGTTMFSAVRDNPMDYLRMLSGIDASAPHLETYYAQMSSWFRPWEEPVYNDARVLIRFNALINLFSMGHLQVHNIFINFLSFSGLVALYRFMAQYFPAEKRFLLPWGVFLFPSLLFWGSGILKEGILLFAFGFFIFAANKLVCNPRNYIFASLWLVVSAFFLVLLKPYNLLFLIPGLIAFYLPGKDQHIHLRFFLIFVLWVGTGILMGLWFPAYDPIMLIARKQNDFINFTTLVEAGSLIEHRYLSPTLPDFLWFAPKAFLNAFLRPHLLESYSLVVLMAALENTIILALMIMTLITTRKALLNQKLVSLSIWFGIALLVFIGLVTPVHGALVRYKIPALPFLWVFFLGAGQWPLMLQNFLKSYKKIEIPKLLNKKPVKP